jgi:hypothetical protein
MPRPRRKLTVDHVPFRLCHESFSLLTPISLAWESNPDLQFLRKNGNDKQKSLEVWLLMAVPRDIDESSSWRLRDSKSRWLSHREVR